MDLFSLLLPLLFLLLVVPIFLSNRSQRRQMQEMRELQDSLETGDVVITTSGLRATVVDTGYEETVDLEIAENVVTTWVRAAIQKKVPDDGPADADLAANPVAGEVDLIKNTGEHGAGDDARANGTPGSRS